MAGLVGIGHPAQDHHEPLALGGAQRVHAAGPGGTAYLVEEVLDPRGRHLAEHHDDPLAVRPSRGRWPARRPPRRPRPAAPSRRPAPRAGRPRRRGPPRPGHRPRRWRRRPRGRSGAPRRGPRRASCGSTISSTCDSTTSIAEPDQVDGLAQGDDAGQRREGRRRRRRRRCRRGRRRRRRGGTSRRSPGCPPGGSGPPTTGSRRSSSPNHGMSVSIRDIAALLRAPVERRSASAARSRDPPGDGGTARTLTARP